jgi:hypothetical protein
MTLQRCELRIEPGTAFQTAETKEQNFLRNRTGSYFGGTGNSGAGTGSFAGKPDLTTG